jgi:hypothetical protein
VNQALANNEWKAATVLAGALVEALLYWAIAQKPPSDIASARDTVGKKRKRNMAADPLDWYLPDFIEAALELKIIRDPAAQQARLSKDFRNLIHPGRAIKEQQDCTRATAFGSVAAVELVIEELARTPRP